MSADLNIVWVDMLGRLIHSGFEVSPRNKPTLELPQATIAIDMRRPVVVNRMRKLNYQFMAAEAYWIISGDDSVAGIAPWNSHIADFSDDGKKFFGAYGPKVKAQLQYVVAKLKKDPDTRQAGLTLWRENPPETKDYPCTIALWFMIRGGLLNCHSFMRSNDVWLGLPYDAFNFSMLSHYVAAHLEGVEPGTLYHTAASLHLYEPQWNEARELVKEHRNFVMRYGYDVQAPTPDFLWATPEMCLDWLMMLRSSTPGADIRWWEKVE